MKEADSTKPVSEAPRKPESLVFPDLRVAVVHDWLTGMRGGEKVLEAILEVFPRSEIFTLFHYPGRVSEQIEKRPIHTSWLQPWCERVGDYRRLLPLFPAAISGWTFQSFDLVVSSSHCVAKGVETGRVPHVTYCHTPMRYIWDRFDDYFPPGRPLLRLVAGIVAPALRSWDVRTADSVDRFIANSRFVEERIRRCYQRDAVVVHPFVDDSFFETALESSRDEHHLVVSALVPYKRIDVAIRACEEAGRRLVVVGDGPMRRELENASSGSTRFTGWVGERELLEIYARARSLIIPGVEDFGITALEAMAAGTPVVSIGEGGALDSVIDGETGLLFDGSVRSLVEAIRRVENTEWNREAIRARSRQFSKDRFRRGLVRVVRDVLECAK